MTAKKIITNLLIIAFVVGFGVLCAFTGPITDPVGTLWSLFPPVIAIGLALITKEAYSSLFVGILVGALLSTGFKPLATVDAIVTTGLIESVSGTAGIFIFLVLLGAVVAMLNKAGGSKAFGQWAAKHVKTKVGAALATFAFGILIFIDDYFNCLTVGAVMRPVTDQAKMSRAKLAYLIDATAAPICMIAPISSWAAAVSEFAPEGVNGIVLFCQAIPYNFYSLLTFVFIIGLTVMKFDYGPMKLHELNAANGDLFTSGDSEENDEEEVPVTAKAKVIDLILPIIVLIGICVYALYYIGDGGNFSIRNLFTDYFSAIGTAFVSAFADAQNFFINCLQGVLSSVLVAFSQFIVLVVNIVNVFVSAFGNTDATVGLPWGGLIAIILVIIYFVARRLLSFKEAMACIPKGFIAMVPAIIILTMATSLKNMTGLLESDTFVQEALANASALQSFLPAIIFLVACFIAFATGTSWGTFGILIPIVLSVFPAGTELGIVGMSACLAGAVCGDHCSPISDTTIMSSAGAQCNHLNHVSTQLPYALTVAAVSFVCFMLAGFVQSAWIVLPVGAVLTVVILFVLKLINKKA